MDSGAPRSPLRVLIADDHALFREGLRTLLEKVGWVMVVGEAGDGREALDRTRQLRPNVVIMDIGMPGVNGLEATRAITRELPDVKVLILTVHATEDFLFEALAAGASGYVLKGAAFADLLSALEVVVRGGVFLYPSLAQKLLGDYLSRVGRGEERSSYDTLTPREKEVLGLVAQGYTNQKIAQRLVISINTVQTHRAHIMDKLNLQSRAELVEYALRMGLLRGPSGP